MAIAPRYALIEFLKVDAKHTTYINKVLNDAAKGLESDIAKMGTKGSPITTMQASAQRASVKSYLDAIFSDVQKDIMAGQTDAAEAASRVVSRYEDQLLGLALDPAKMRQVARSEAARAAKGVEAALRRMDSSYKPLSKTVYNTSVAARKGVNAIIDRGLASGWDARRLASELAGSISPNTPGGVAYAAKRTARTEINNAYHASAAKRYDESPFVVGVDWNLSTSHPEGDVCDELAADSPYDTDAVPEKPHPFCFCFITPKMEDEDAFLDNLFEGKYDDDLPDGAAAVAKATADYVQPKRVRTTADLDLESGVDNVASEWREMMSGPEAKDFGSGAMDVRAAWDWNGMMDALPTQMSAADYEEAVRKGASRMFRGLQVPPSYVKNPKSPAEMMDQFNNGKHFGGRGIYGNGSYFAEDASLAKYYADDIEENVFEYALKPDARIADYETLDAERIKLTAALNKKSNQINKGVPKGKKNTEYMEMASSFSDLGTYASYMGYDGIRVPNKIARSQQNVSVQGDFIVVLNRSALIQKKVG
jgi:hypothetical protein